MPVGRPTNQKLDPSGVILPWYEGSFYASGNNNMDVQARARFDGEVHVPEFRPGHFRFIVPGGGIRLPVEVASLWAEYPKDETVSAALQVSRLFAGVQDIVGGVPRSERMILDEDGESDFLPRIYWIMGPGNGGNVVPADGLQSFINLTIPAQRVACHCLVFWTLSFISATSGVWTAIYTRLTWTGSGISFSLRNGGYADTAHVFAPRPNHGAPKGMDYLQLIAGQSANVIAQAQTFDAPIQFYAGTPNNAIFALVWAK